MNVLDKLSDYMQNTLLLDGAVQTAASVALFY